jgi:signal transduction histidine kinase/CheY-like chemotaxis protein
VSFGLLTLQIEFERDVVLARQRARRIAELMGFDAQEQTRIATAVSEIARNAFRYAGGGRVEFRVEGRTSPQLFWVRVGDRGPGIEKLESVLDGSYRSDTGMGIGIVGARRLMDRFHIESAPSRGTRVTLGKLLPHRARPIDASAAAEIAAELARQEPSDPFQELQRQNQELLRALDQLERRQQELAALNRELEDTNRGVVALYAELDEKADHLRRADELKSRFLSNMTHEFRTPVNSIQALARMLLDRSEGDLTAEQVRQVQFIARAADSLSELVNDLLDLAKVEAGKIEVSPVEFDVEHLFGALRGMLRPLLVNESLKLVFEESEAQRILRTDEGKVSQILRNFVSNALKFTDRGEVRVSARVLDDGMIAFSVSDTGIGIAPEHHERIFEEFTQVDNPIQRRVRGTGLGLPLCRKLAELLGGRVSVESEPGVGSTFTATLPIVFDPSVSPRPFEADPSRIPLLLVEDNAETALLLEQMLFGSGYQVLAARSLREAREAIAAVRPRVVLLDLLLKGEDSWSLLAELKRRPETREIPVAILSAIEERGKAHALGADAYLVKPIDRKRLLQTVTGLIAPESLRRVLLVEDEDVHRYVLRQHLSGETHVIFEASDGAEGLLLAQRERPDVICLDLGLPGLPGDEVLRRLKDDPSTREIPVVIVTSRSLDASDRSELMTLAASVLPKQAMTRERALAAVEEALRASGRAA